MTLLFLLGTIGLVLLWLPDSEAANPHVMINEPPAMSVVQGSVNVTGNASDPDGNATLDRVELRTEGGGWSQATAEGPDLSFWFWLWDTDVLVEGFYTLQARAHDGGNYSSWYNLTLRVDRNEAPQVGVNLANDSWVNGTLKLTGSALDPEGASNLSHIELSLNDETFADPWTANGTFDWYYVWNTRLYSSGEHILYLRAWDKGGLNSTPLALYLTINQRPQLTFNEPLTRQGWIFFIDYDTSDAEGDLRAVTLFAEPVGDPEGRLTIAASLGASGTFQWNCSGNDSGPYLIYGRVLEETGQSNLSLTHPIYVPLIVATVISPEPGGAESDFETLVRWKVEGPDDDRLTTLYLDDDTDAANHIQVIEYLQDQKSYLFNTRYLEEGEYFIRIRVRQASFTTDVYSGRLTVEHDNTKPFLMFLEPVAREGWTVKLKWETSDNEDDIRNVTFLADPGGADLPIPFAEGLGASGTYLWNCSEVKAGKYDIIGRVTDGLGASRDVTATQRIQVPEFLVFMTEPPEGGQAEADESYVLKWRIETAKASTVNIDTTTLFLDNDTNPDNGNTTLAILLKQTSYVWDLTDLDEGVYYVLVVASTGLFSEQDYSGPLNVVHLEQTLQIVNFSYKPQEPREGVRLEFTTNIRNPGSGDARMDVQYTLNGVSIATHDVYITAKGTATDLMSWTAEPGTHTLRVRLLRSGYDDADQDKLYSFTVAGPIEQEEEGRSLIPLIILIPLTLGILFGALIITNIIPLGEHFGFGGRPSTPPGVATYSPQMEESDESIDFNDDEGSEEPSDSESEWKGPKGPESDEGKLNPDGDKVTDEDAPHSRD